MASNENDISLSKSANNEPAENGQTIHHQQPQTNKQFQTIIPMSRVKTIMKSSPEIANINSDTLFLVCKATELFIQTFAKEAYKISSKDSNMDYNKLASLVDKDDRFQFLSEIVPFKMKAKDALKLIEAEKRNNQ